MATTRKDLRGRTLRKGEMQRSSDKRYAYSYTDPLGRRKYIYANDLVTLRRRKHGSPKTRWTVWIFTLQAKQQSILCLTAI